jgi:sporulation protein YlmC with PRC-barrel domain
MRTGMNVSSRPLALVVTLALFTAAAGTASAQQNDNAPVAGHSTLGTTRMEVIAEGWRASKLIGASVYNESNQRVGKIGDLIIAPDGSISVAVLDVGGFLGVAGRHVAIPVEQFSQISPRIVLPGATKDALKQLPEFKYVKG